MRLGIFGGTFNPPHMGHIRLVTAIADKLQLDHVLIIPASVPPHKHVLNLARSRDRFEMCRLSFEGDRRFSVSDTELLRVGKSYTYDTLCEIKKKYPDAELFLIVGSDMLATFDEWYRYHDILMMCTLCAASRKATSAGSSKTSASQPHSALARYILSINFCIIASSSPVSAW